MINDDTEKMASRLDQGQANLFPPYMPHTTENVEILIFVAVH